MPKPLLAVVVVLLAIVGLGFGARMYANRAMSNRAVTPKTLASATPASAGIPFSRVAIEAGDRTLIGWWVRARADSGRVPPALLFLHGNRSSISDYIALQKFLYKQGVSSLVFDYSGFGASGGTPSLKNAIADAGYVARVFADSAGKAARKVAMGSALGATVLLQAIDSVQPYVNGIVLEGVDASVRTSAVRSGKLPKLIAPLVEDPGNNVAAASRVKVPLLAVHSYADNRVPIEDAQMVVSSVKSPVSIVRHARKGHSALLSSSRACDWAQVLAFVKTGTLPASKLETTDVCEQQRLAAAATAAAKKTVTPAGHAVPAAGTGAKTGTATKTTSSKTAATKSTPTKTKTKTTSTKKPTSSSIKNRATKKP